MLACVIRSAVIGHKELGLDSSNAHEPQQDCTYGTESQSQRYHRVQLAQDNSAVCHYHGKKILC